MQKDLKQVYDNILSFIETCDYDNAKELMEEYLKYDKDNVEILDLYAEVLVNLNLPEQAKQVLKRSIELAPESNGDKYMSLAQLSESKHALKLYLKGIDIYKKELECNIINSNEIKISMASGYAAVAELYMNSDLCNEKNAEKNVEKYLKTALQYDENNVDALLQFSNLRILRCKDKEAVEFMDKIYQRVNNCVENNLENYPSLEVLLQLAKNYLELEFFPKSIKLLDLLVKFDDENLEYWYLLAYCHFKIQNYKHSMKCVKNLFKVKNKIKDDDNEIEVASKELLNELNKLGELTNNKLFEDTNLEYADEERCEDENYSSTQEMNID